jgi:hypothetical protein
VDKKAAKGVGTQGCGFRPKGGGGGGGGGLPGCRQNGRATGLGVANGRKGQSAAGVGQQL